MAQRLKHIFAVDVETCPKCGGRLSMIAYTEDPDVIANILEHIRARNDAQTPQPRAPPRRTQPSNQERVLESRSHEARHLMDLARSEIDCSS